MAALLAGILVVLVSRGPASAPALAGEAAGVPAGVPPDISAMSPRERFDRLYNKVMSAAQSGDKATVSQFTPMALMAYGQLDSFDADARYHAALLDVHTGNTPGALALADSILAETPSHLFGFIIRGTVARFRNDDRTLAAAYAGFLRNYDRELKAPRPEYQEHSRAVDEFHRAALAAGKAGS